jgi:CO/xanthine dehydrogenase FAD-binding subunit
MTAGSPPPTARTTAARVTVMALAAIIAAVVQPSSARRCSDPRRCAARPDAVFLAGGTSLLDHMKLGIAGSGLLVDITGSRWMR